MTAKYGSKATLWLCRAGMRRSGKIFALDECQHELYYSSNNECEYLLSLKKTLPYQYLNKVKHPK